MKRKDTVAPNAFVSIRVRSSTIRMKMEEVQAAMGAKEPKVAASLVPLEKLHVTLMVVNLRDKEQIEMYASLSVCVQCTCMCNLCVCSMYMYVCVQCTCMYNLCVCSMYMYV